MQPEPIEFWVSRLREQIAQIASGDYQPGTPAFSRAPGGMAELSRDLDDLAQAMAVREVARGALAREVHDRVRNNLQIITSLLDMQASRVKDPAASEALSQTRVRIGAMVLIQRGLYHPEGDSEVAGVRPTFAIARLMPELCRQLRQAHQARREVTFTCHADAMDVPVSHALPLALFTVEAVSNAYTHAFHYGRSGTVDLRFWLRDDGMNELCITDDGDGFDSSQSGRSLGRELMLGFAGQLGGTVRIESNAGTGTTVRLEYLASAANPSHQIAVAH